MLFTFWEYNGLWQPSLPVLNLIILPISPWQRGNFKGLTDLEQTANLATYHMNATISLFIPSRTESSALRSDVLKKDESP